MWRLKQFFKTLSDKLSFKERIYPTPEAHYGHKKDRKMAILKLGASEDLIEIRNKISECDVVFIDISRARRDELSHNVIQIKSTAHQKNSQVYGLDPNWIVVSSFEKGK